MSSVLTPLLLLVFHSGPTRPSDPGPTLGARNVIVIVADDVAWQDVLDVPTPNIDALAASGMLFERGYANPSCCSSRRSLHFGRWWSDSRGEYCKPPDEFTPGSMPTMPKLAQSLGYTTALFGKWHVGSSHEGAPIMGPRFHGYDTWRAGIAANIAGPVCAGAGSYDRWDRIDDGVITPSLRHTGLEIRDAFLEWWTGTRRPRFAVVSFQLAHQPFEVPPAELLPPGTVPATTQRRKFHQMVQAVDTLVGQVLSVVGPEDLVFFVGDNGTPQGVAPEQDRAKGTSFERGIRVPFIVRGPGIRRGQVSQSLVHLADIYATLADMARQPLDNGQGASLVPLFRNPNARVHDYIVCGRHQRQGRLGGGEAHIDRCIRTERYKLRVVRLDGAWVEEFYDLELDPEERAPIPLDSSEYADEIRALRAHYEEVLPTL